AAVRGDDALAIRELGPAALDVPDAGGLPVLWRQLRLVLHELGDRIADAAVVGALWPLHGVPHLIPGNPEGHLVVLGLAADAVGGAGKDHLRLVRPHGGHDDLGAVDAAPEGGGELAAALPEGGLGQAHDLGGVRVDAHEVRLERRAIERRYQQGRVLARCELVDRGFRPLPGRLRLRVHPPAERPRVVQVRRLLEAEGRDAERADVVLARERDHPAVAPGHVDDLAVHAELLEVAGRSSRPLGNRLARPHAPAPPRGRLWADVELKLPISRLDVDHVDLPSERTTSSNPLQQSLFNGCRIRPPHGQNSLTEASTMQSPSASYSLTVRLEITNRPGMLGQVTS